jgi:hypothetical protein
MGKHFLRPLGLSPELQLRPECAAYGIMLTDYEVEHITDLGDGRSHESFTQTWTALPVGCQKSVRGSTDV